MALSASILWSNLIKPTPLERPVTDPSPLEPPGTEDMGQLGQGPAGGVSSNSKEESSQALLLALRFATLSGLAPASCGYWGYMAVS